MNFKIEKISEKIEVINKPKGAFKIAPNMEDYEAACSTFSWEQAAQEIDWFDNNKLNAAYNAIDRNAKNHRRDKIALHWISENNEHEQYTFNELNVLSNKFANILIGLEVKKQDRVFIFLPRIPELYSSFLGTLKMGAIGSTMFAAFGPEGLRDRLKNGQATVLVTIPSLLKRIEPIIDELPDLKHVIVIDNRHSVIITTKSKLTELVKSYKDLIKDSSAKFETVPMNPEDYAFMLYTSGTTGKPKGVVHCHQAIIQQHLTAKWVLDLKEDDIYWCTADPGWVTGISYGILGSWSNGATTVVHGGRFDPDIWYSIIQDQKVTVWYTAPTAIRMLMQQKSEVVSKYDLSSLRHLLSVGEPLNPEAIRWGLKVFGLPFHDSWWQTETGSILISNYPSLPIKLGSMGKPFPGIEATIVDDNGNSTPSGYPGNLAIKPPWPSIMSTIWQNEPKYREYFKGDWYISGDKAYTDEDGYFWFIGRADDLIKTAGERVGPFEVESILVEHPAIAEAGVIGKPDPLRGEIIKAFVVLSKSALPSEELKDDIRKYVKSKLAGYAYPREIEFATTLPRTQSGKIMRRVLKAQELGLPIGDLSTLEE